MKFSIYLNRHVFVMDKTLIFDVTGNIYASFFGEFSGRKCGDLFS